MIKKIVSIFLSTMILMSCLCINVTADTEDSFTKEEDVLDKIESNALGDGQGELTFEVVTKVLDKLNEQFPKLEGFAKVVNVLGTIGTYGANGVAVFNGVMSALKIFGVIQDPEKEFKKDVIDKLNGLQQSTDEIITKVEGVSEKLDKYYVSISSEFNQKSIKDAIQELSNFTRGTVQNIKNRIVSLGSKLSTCLLNWVGRDENSKKEVDRTFVADLFERIPDINESFDYDLSNISKGSLEALELANQLDKDYKNYQVTIDNEIIDKSIDEIGYKPKTQIDLQALFEKCFDNIYQKIANNTNIEELSEGEIEFARWLSGFILKNAIGIPNSTLQNFNPDGKTSEEVVGYVQKYINYNLIMPNGSQIVRNRNQLFANAKRAFVYYAASSLELVFIKNIVLSGALGTDMAFAEHIFNEYAAYTTALSETKYQGSPILKELEVISRSHNFQGEIYEELERLESLYLGDFIRYSQFYLTLLSYHNDNNFFYNSALKSFAETLNTMSELFDNFVKKDENGKPLDNYSYLFKSPIEIIPVDISQTMTAKTFEVYEIRSQTEKLISQKNNSAYIDKTYEFSPWKYVEYSPNGKKIVNPKPINENILNNMADNADMLALYNIYLTNNQQGLSFSDYLQINTLGEVKYNLNTSRVYTSKITANNIKSLRSSNIEMSVDHSSFFASPTTKNTAKFKPNSQKIGGKKLNDNKYVVADTAYANVFDMSNGKNIDSETIQSRAYYVEDYILWNYDRWYWFYTDEGTTNTERVLDSIKYSEREMPTYGGEYTVEGRVYNNSISTYVPGYIVNKEAPTSSNYASLVSNLFDVDNISENSQILNGALEETIKPLNYINAVYKDIPYGIYYNKDVYDTGSSKIDEETFAKFMEYAEREDVIESMKASYNSRIKQIINNKLFNYDGVMDLDLDADTLKKLCDAVKEEYKEELEGAVLDDGSYKKEIKGTEDEYVYLPTIDAPKLCAKYVITYVPIYELNMDDKGVISYTLHDYYDITPVLVWRCNGEVKYTEVNNNVLENVGLSIKVKLPIIDAIDASSNKANINHFYNMDNVKEPYEVLKANIKSNSTGKYLEFESSSFSPFSIANYYKDSESKYVVPKTGIE